jgi:RNA polymerase sigma factor for flagellar operon FliA
VSVGGDRPGARDPGFEQPADTGALWTELRQTRSARARDQLFAHFTPFAERIARRRFLARTGGDIELNDLKQLAFAGLLEAIDRFDPALGAPFEAYAAGRISGSILDGIAKMSEMREQVRFRNRARRERLRSIAPADGGTGLSTGEAMQAFVDLAVGLAIGFMLEGTTLYQSENTPSPFPGAYESLAWKQSLRRVLAVIDQLPAREQKIIRGHYIEGLSFDALAGELGVSKGRVSQLHKAAIGRLRALLPGIDDFRLRL